MAERLRTKNWSVTSLGPRETWPASLDIIVSVMLASGFPMCVRWGPDLVMIYNDGYRSILGSRHPHAFGLPFHEAWPEVQDQLRPIHQAILNGTSGAYFAEDLLIKVQRRGNPEWEDARFTLSYSPVPDDNAPNGVGGVLVTVVETSGRVRTEEALRASEERFARIFEQTAVGVIQCELDGQFLLVNKRFCEITGRTAEELLALKVPDITHPDDRENDTALRRRLFADGIPFYVEKRYLRPDGSLVWVGVDVSLMRSADGTRQQIIGVAQDITERKAAQAGLREKEADLRLVLDSATDGVYCVDTDGVTTMCNAAFLRMLGMSSEEQAIGRKLHDVIHHSHPDGSSYPKEAYPIYRTASDGVPAHVEHELFFRLDGTSFPVEYWVSPIERDGNHQGAVCTFIDITERRRAQEQQNLLLRELSHRIKNLFAITGGMIALSARSAATPKEYAANIRGRLDALARAHDLILPGSSGNSLGAEPIGLDVLLRQVLSPYMETKDEAEGARIVLDGAPVALGPHTTTTFALILHELATNAAKYGSLSVVEGKLRVAWACVDGHLAMRWEETGGPALTGPPGSEGFGTLLSNHSVRGQLGGTLSHSWNQGGLSVELSIPLERLAY
ncbi:MAG TPA: PAS domain S-box protein [Xanthobacteraceae bacterium]|jgi:PAS domain S-box-containing protein|nr:PAS domain S-box protein [Xanthobacteraceae bacterium]